MDNMIETVRQEVEAALLNSECHPRDAVIAALKAVREFAITEAGLQGSLSVFVRHIEDEDQSAP